MLQVRVVREDDLPGLTAVRYTDHPAIHLDRIQASDRAPKQYFVAELAGQIVGFGLLILQRPLGWTDRVESFPLVVDLFVAEAQRGRGIGRALMAAMEEAARQQGKTEIFLSVGPEANPRAAALYARLGYVPLQGRPYLHRWEFTDSDGGVHIGEEWIVDMRKRL